MYSDDDDYFYFRREYMYDTDDSGPYYDDDDYYDDDYDYYDSDNETKYARRMAELKMKREKEKISKEIEIEDKTPKVFHCKPLVNICARFLALNFPFAYLQDRFPPIPDDLQLKVITLSFPESEEKIRKYAEFSRSGADIMYPSKLCNAGKVKDMLQIGFRLSASVEDKYVTIHFDRGKITSAQCTCDSSSSWCTHVIATALMRIRHADSLDKSKLRLPVSDALNVLSREQLLKFSQYLLYHHQNHKIVETAQDLIDKLVNRHGDHSEEEINIVHGAPDPTAGPGLDEDCHWFVCSNGFKENCSNLIYESPENLGFAPLEFKEECSHLLHEMWYRNRCQHPLVQDDIDTEVGAEFYCAYSLERRQDSSKILETVLELLKDDSMSGLVAIKSCTEQLLSRLEKKGSPYESRRLSRTSSSQAVKKPLYPCGSPAMGFTSRPFRCWTLVDELSTLWQVAVLNPKMNVKEKQEVSLQLMKWNEEAATGCFIEKLQPWKGLEVAYNLCQYIDWHQPEMQSILHGRILGNCVINGCALVHINIENGTEKSHTSLHCLLPYSFLYGNITLDIHTWCSIINALQVHNYQKPAVNIAFSLSLALISLFRNNVETRTWISNIPVVVNCTLDHGLKSSSDNAKHQCKSESMDTDDKSCGPSCPEIWPADALLSLRCFAFLCEFLSKHDDVVETLIASHKEVLDPSGNKELASTLDKISSTHSLRFQTAALGLFLLKFPMATLKQEAEQYDIENWLSFQLLESKPTSDDMGFLTQLCKVALSDDSHWPLAPASSFTRITLYHSFKDSNSSGVAANSPLQNKGLVLELVDKTLDFTQVFDSHGWTLFEFSNAVSWSKLAELSLSCFAGYTTYTERAITSILKPNGILGPGKYKHLMKTSSDEVRSNTYCVRNTMDGKSKVCFALAKALMARLKRSSSKKGANMMSRIVPMRDIFTGIRNRMLDVFPKVESPLAVMALKKSAIRLGAHSVYLEKTSNRSYSHGSAIRWLIDCAIECGLWGIRCLIKSHSDISDFLHHEEAINLCKSMLRKKDDSMIPMVKEILLSLLRQAIKTEATDNVRDIIMTCRENNRETSYLLTPWVCQHIHDMALYSTVHFESLMFASEQVFKCYTHKLFQTTSENQRMKGLEGELGLKRLFEGNEDSDSEETSSKTPVPQNPYITLNKPHPYLELSFELGIMGLNVLPREEEGVVRRYGRAQRDKKERLHEFCEVVCYIATKKWLDYDNRHGATSDKRHAVASSSTGASREIEEAYISRFVTDLLKAITNPMLLLTFLRDMSSKLFPDEKSCRTIGDEIKPTGKYNQAQLRKAIHVLPSLLLLIQRIESQFKELLLGSKLTILVKTITDRRPHSTAKDLRAEFEYHDLEEDTLKDTLRDAKVVFEVMDSSGESFKKLVSDIQKKHEELKPVLDGILSGEEISRHRDGDLFRNPFFFWPFIQELQFGRRHPLEDWLN